MALLKINMQSKYLQGNEQVAVILPDKPRQIQPSAFYGKEIKFKVLWLLHGGYGDYSDWLRKSRIELYACENDLMVVMPSALNSQYTSWPNFATGYDMYSFLVKELMPMVYNWLPASKARKDNFIAGLSMGGGGAFRYAIRNPELFAAAAVLSWAPVNFEETDMEKPVWKKNLVKLYGSFEKLLDSEDNLWRAAKEVSAHTQLPRFYFSMGKEDHLFGQYDRFQQYAEEIGFPAEFHAVPGFAHEWRFWDDEIVRILDFFGIHDGGKGNAY